MHCPWNQWPQAELTFCEEILCAWVKQPGNTWSNIGYLIIGIWIWSRSSRSGFRSLRMLSIAALMTGVGSALFHATGTKWAGGADLLGMFMGTGALTALNTRRWLGSRWSFNWGIFGIVSLVLLALTGAFPNQERWIYGLSGPCCLIELRLAFRDRSFIKYRNYFFAWLLVGFATLFWWMDIEGVLCDPANHYFSGHALWHLLSAAAFYPLYLYYLQFPTLRD